MDNTGCGCRRCLLKNCKEWLFVTYCRSSPDDTLCQCDIRVLPLLSRLRYSPLHDIVMALQRNVGINSPNSEAHFPTSWTFNYQQHPRPRPMIAWVWDSIMRISIAGCVCLFRRQAGRHRLPAEGHSLVTATLSAKWCLIEALSPRTKEPNHI